MPDNDLTTTACTIVARNYLPAARVLASSYLEHHPGHRVVIEVIDGAPDGSPVPGADVVGSEALAIDEQTYLRMATSYTVMELATAVKPYLLRELRRSSDVVVYLDPDIQVFAPLSGVTELAAEHSIVLTPHNLDPLPRDGKEPDETVIMGTGLFNLGFIAVGPGSGPFLDFWADRLQQDAIVAPDRQRFTDQRWVDFVPSLFTHHVLRDRGMNVAYWNAWERPLSLGADGAPWTGGTSVKFVHFSGYRPDRPWLLSSHCARDPRVLLSEYPVLRELCDSYGTKLLAAGYPARGQAYRYAATPEGTALTPWMRHTFRNAWIDAERTGTERTDTERTGTGRETTALPPHPFGADGGAPFLAWLAAPADPRQAAAGLNRLVMEVWARRLDLQQAFPDPTGEHAEAFRSWCRDSGSSEGEIPEWALPRRVPPRSAPQDRFGVNLVGYLTAELGLGEMGRIVHDALASAGVPTATVVEDWSVSNRTGLPQPVTAGDPVFPVTLLCVNADQTNVVLATHPEIAHRRYVIGLWAWELEDFPAWQHSAFEQVDEVWTISEFCRAAIARHATVPVRVIPVPVRATGSATRDRPSQGAPDGPIRFLFAFDFNSVGQRKNPWGLVEAFHRAFPDEPDARLTIKAINGDRHPHAAERLRVAIAGDQRIELVERYVTVNELDELYARSDCYVSLHRSEGFGLTVIEAMARGLPVIVTDYSGTSEFVTPDTGWAIGHDLVPVGEGCFPYHPDAVWADPDLDQAARAMRTVFDDPREARRRGLAARDHVLSTRTMAAAADWMRARLTEAHRHWRSGGTQRAAGGSGSLASAREALRWRADASAPSRIPGAPALRRGILRAIDHYDVHQRTVHAAMLDGVEDGIRELAARLESVRADFDQRLTAVNADRIGALETRLDEQAKDTHDLLVERDQRADQLGVELAQTKRDLAALLRWAERDADTPREAVAVLCDAGVLLLPRDDQVVRPWIEYHRSWEEPEADLLAALVRRRPGTFLDVGAHVGYHTVRLLHREAVPRVVAVEPQSAVAGLLRANVERARTAARVTILQAAAWDSDGTVAIRQFEEGNSGDVRVVTNGASRIRAVRLDGVAEVRDSEVTVVKVDLQGRDHRALSGLSAVLLRDRPDVLCEFCPEAIEELGDDPVEVLDGYRALGYQLCDLDGSPDAAERLVARARASAEGFITMWLRPVPPLTS